MHLPLCSACLTRFRACASSGLDGVVCACVPVCLCECHAFEHVYHYCTGDAVAALFSLGTDASAVSQCLKPRCSA